MGWRGRTRVLVKDTVKTVRRAALPPLRALAPAHYSDADPYKVITVPTERLATMQKRWHGSLDLPWLDRGPFGHLSSHRRRWHAGRVLDGDWDIARQPLDDHHLASIFRERYVLGREWREIPYIRRAIRKVERGERAWGGRCGTRAEVLARCRYIDALHDRLRAGGFRADAASDFTHLTVNVARCGELIRNNDGKHRIILSRLIGVPHLEARVFLRHTGWQAIRDRIRAGDRGLAARHRHHPDLADVLYKGRDDA